MIITKKIHKKVIYKNTITNKLNTVKFGEYAIMSLECGSLKKQQIEAAKNTIKKKIKKLGHYWQRIDRNNSFPITNKPAQIRMGKGKGNISEHIYYVKKNEVLFEVSGISEKFARRILYNGSIKLPINVKFISNQG
jgi:large subunit ribosomal protein L16